MQYKLIEGSLNDIYNPKLTVLKNRGIEDIDIYLNLDDNVLYHYSLLDNIGNAVRCLLEHIEKGNNIHIVVDSDPDGYCSSTLIYRYIKHLNPDINLTYSIHTGKQHGLSDDIIIPENINLLIIPDAGSNDVQQCEELRKKGVDIIILDHHIVEQSNPYAIVINNQACNYPNKDLCGTGIVYKFLQALDEETWNDYADHFLDLVALANIADVMDIRSYETKRLIDKGLSQIKNKLFKALIEKQSYSINNNITISNIQFYIVPLINAIIRAGDYDEKDMLFRAFIETDEVFKYKPRRVSKNDPEPEEIDENIYARVARLAVNARSRQNRSKDKDLIEIIKDIESKGYDKNKIIVVNVTEKLNQNMTGLVAMNVASKYNKPCLLLRQIEDKEGYYGGSARNSRRSVIKNLKDFLESTELFSLLQGHQDAFGVEIHKDNIPKAIEVINEKLKDVSLDFYYEVDFVMDAEGLDVRFVKEMDELKSVYGQGVEEALLVIKNIIVEKDNISLLGKESNTLKFIYNDEISFIKFRVSEDDEIIKWLDDWDDEEEYKIINVVGKAGINYFNGIATPQIIIEDYEVC